MAIDSAFELINQAAKKQPMPIKPLDVIHLIDCRQRCNLQQFYILCVAKCVCVCVRQFACHGLQRCPSAAERLFMPIPLRRKMWQRMEVFAGKMFSVGKYVNLTSIHVW